MTLESRAAVFSYPDKKQVIIKIIEIEHAKLGPELLPEPTIQGGPFLPTIEPIALAPVPFERSSTTS